MVCHDVVDQIVSSKLTEGTFEFTPVVEELFQTPLGKKTSDIKNKIIQGLTPQVFHQRETRKCYRLLFSCSAILPDVRHVQRSLLIASTDEEQCSLPLFSFFFYWCLVRDKKSSITVHSKNVSQLEWQTTKHRHQYSTIQKASASLQPSHRKRMLGGGRRRTNMNMKKKHWLRAVLSWVRFLYVRQRRKTPHTGDKNTHPNTIAKSKGAGPPVVDADFATLRLSFSASFPPWTSIAGL